MERREKREKICDTAFFAADPGFDRDHVSVLCHDAHRGQRRHHGALRRQGRRGAGDHRRQTRRARAGQALSAAVRLLAGRHADRRYGHELRLRTGRVQDLHLQAPGDAAADGAVHRGDGRHFDPAGRAGRRAARPLHGLSAALSELHRKLHAELLRGHAAHCRTSSWPCCSWRSWPSSWGGCRSSPAGSA